MKRAIGLIIIGIFLLFHPLPSYAADINTTGKLITVDTGAQMLYAWDNGNVVYQTPVSTGLPQSPTVLGDYNIYLKYKSQEMIGYSPVEGAYDLPNVPNVMYFYQGYSIHGAYWHNNFGHPMSNGCVNTPIPASEWLYNWTPTGTKVEIY